MTMVSSVPPEASFVVLAADEEEPYFPVPPEGPLVVVLAEVVALPVLGEPPLAEDPPAPPPPSQLASTTASTSVRAPTASAPFSALFIVLSLLPLGRGVSMDEHTDQVGESYHVGPPY